MYFAVVNNLINCRLCVDKSKNHELLEVPYSTLFGFFGDHFFEYNRIKNNSFERDPRSMIEFYRDHPVEYSFIYKNNSSIQGKNANLSDYGITKGNGEGNKPTHQIRTFDKEILLFFKLVNNFDDMELFNSVWTNRNINLKKVPVKKEIIDDEWDYEFDSDRPYYRYQIEKTDNVLEQNKMLFMLDSNRVKSNIYVRTKKLTYDSFDWEEFSKEMVWSSTEDILK